MKRTVLTGMGTVIGFLIATSVSAQSPDVRVWISQPTFVSPGATVNESLKVNFRNKGDATALGTQITITFPPGLILTGGNNPYNAGDLGVSNTVYDYTLYFTVDGSVPAGTPLTITATADFSDGVTPLSTTKDTLIDPVLFPVNTLVPSNNLDDNTWADYSPDGSRVVYSGADFDYPGSDEQEIFTINPDGTNRTRLTFNSNCDQKPSFSPDGSMIAFTRYGDSGTSEIWVMNTDGSAPHSVAIGGCNFPRWTPDGRVLFFQGGCSSSNNTAWIVNADGSNLQMVSEPGIYVTYEYDVDSTGNYLLTHNNNSWTALPYIRMLDISNPASPSLVGLYGFMGEAHMMYWQPGTDRFIFKDDLIGYGQIYSMKMDRSEFLMLSAEKAVDEYQLSDNDTAVTIDNWYPLEVEGVWLATDTSHGGTNYLPGGNYEIWSRQITLGTALPAGRTPVIVTYKYIPYYCEAKPHYSADGQWIVYRSEKDGYRAYWVMRWDGTMKTRLTFHSSEYWGKSKDLPIIRPDNQQILFSTMRDGSWDYSLMTIEVDLSTISSMPHVVRGQ